MRSQMTAVFDAWVSRKHDHLKREIPTCELAEDAFQETYLAMREAVNLDTDFEGLFREIYKQMLAKEYHQEDRFIRPNPLFFAYLQAEPSDTGVEENSIDEAITAKQVDDFVKCNFPADDYMIFHLKFFAAMTYQGLIDYTGHSSATIARKLNNIKATINKQIAPIRR